MLNILKPEYIVLALDFFVHLKTPIAASSFSLFLLLRSSRAPWSNLHTAIPELFKEKINKKHTHTGDAVNTHFFLCKQKTTVGLCNSVQCHERNTLIIIWKTHTADTSEGCLFLKLWCLVLRAYNRDNFRNKLAFFTAAHI